MIITQYESKGFDNASFSLSENFTNLSTPYTGGCTLNPAASTVLLLNSEPALQLLANISDTAMVRQATHSDGRKYAYVGLPMTESNAGMDYRATSFGVQTQCRPITSHCIDEERDITGPGATYNCDFGAMQGRIQTSSIDTMVMTYFSNSTLSSNNTVLTPLANPYYFGAVLSVNQNIGSHRDLVDDPEIINGLHGSTLFALLCNATVLDFEYTSVNGSVTYFSGTTSNSSTTGIVMSTQGYTFVGDSYIIPRTSLEVWQSHTAQEVADKFAYTYSQTALAAIGGALVPGPAVEAQLRSSMLVAEVPKIPLACLLLANLLLVLLGILLTIVAFFALSDDVGDVQARLSIAALVAPLLEPTRGEDAVEQIDQQFQELNGIDGPRVGIERTALGGLRFVSHSST